MAAYYNEIDPFAVQWLRNLILAGYIADGDVDDRSIVDVHPGDLLGYTQCHFFAGIGIWSHALRSAGWADDRVVWTGSCPCQPFSTQGKKRGLEDERHLWPAWFRLIEKCRPDVCFGEQVAGGAGLAWFDVVSADLERESYAVGAADLCAAGVGAPHIRQRLYWVADAVEERCEGIGVQLRSRQPQGEVLEASGGGEVGRVGDAVSANAGRNGGGGRASQTRLLHGRKVPRDVGNGSRSTGPWGDAEWWSCTDGKVRPAQHGAFPLANGDSGRLGRLRAYGNAIVAPVAEAFVRAYMEMRP
jgi:DNA (cytosine-5)-methyltransferase 1